MLADTPAVIAVTWDRTHTPIGPADTEESRALNPPASAGELLPLFSQFTELFKPVQTCLC